MKPNQGISFNPDPTLAQRLLAKTRRADSGCLLWTGVTNPGGYGLIKNGPKRARRMVLTHRAAYAVWVRPLHDGEHVLHRCDTPLCVEPTHLFLGDHGTNMRDMIAKGRRVHEVLPDQVGSANSQTHLTEDDVRAMRAQRASGLSLGEIAEHYDVARSTASRICSGRTWTHVA